MADIALGLHGGCGTPARELLSEAEWTESRAHLGAALRAGWKILRDGGSALDAVQAAVVVMEDSPHFNAGHGAALTDTAEHELDASIMDGSDLAAGAVAIVRRTRNPVLAARAVMDDGRAVLLSGPAADAFAERRGLAMVEPAYFTTQRRLDALRKLQDHGRIGGFALASEADKHGTVGAVARDAHGHLAAATSTGGFNNKPVGRVGDTPIIGAGTYAQDGVCAVSCTGQGEYFIRHAGAYDVGARMRYAGESLEAATDTLVFTTLKRHGIGSGLVAVGATGLPVAPFSTLGMFRGWVDAAGEVIVGTHAEMQSLGAA